VPKLLAQNMLALLGGERLLRLFADLLCSASTLSRRSLISIVSSTSCFSEGFASMMPAMKSASADAESNFSIAAATSPGTFGSSSIASRARLRTRLTRASTSAVMTPTMPISSTRATKNGKLGRNSITRKRRMPCATT